MAAAFWASVLAGLATGLGALPIVFIKKFSHRLRDVLLAFAAGVMVAASAFNLIVPALNEGSIFSVVSGILFGALILGLLRGILRISTMRNFSVQATKWLQKGRC